MKRFMPVLLLVSLSLAGCSLEDTDGDGIPDVYDTKDDRPGAGELDGVDYNGNQFVTPTPSPVPSPNPVSSPTASPTASPVASPTASPTPLPTPELLLSPQSVSIPYSTYANLSVLARGDNLNYKWYQGIRGSITTPVGNDSPLFSTGTLTSSTLYWVLVGNDGGSVPSEAVLVTVLDPVPVITGQPQDLDVVSGETVEFAVTATGPNLSYQWFNGAPPDTSDPVVGATSPIFAAGPLTEITSYWVQVSNSGATVNSVAATAFIVDLPEILVQPDSVSIFSEEQATLVVTAISADAPTYQWYQGTSPNEENPLVGETADSIITVPLTTTTSYWVKVANAAGETFSDTAVVTVRTVDDLPTATFPPEIIAQPTSTVIPQGGSTSLAVAVNSLGDPTFQWFRGLSGDESDPVEGATSTVLDTGPLDVTTTYWVKVTNAAGSADSEAATVEVTVL